MDYNNLLVKKTQFINQNLSKGEEASILRGNISILNTMSKIINDLDENSDLNDYEIRSILKDGWNDVLRLDKDYLPKYSTYEIASSKTLSMLVGYQGIVCELEKIVDYYLEDEIVSDNKKITINIVKDYLIKAIKSLATYIFYQFEFEDWLKNTEKITEVSDVIYYFIQELKDESDASGDEFDKIETICDVAKWLDLMMNTYNPYSSEFDE